MSLAAQGLHGRASSARALQCDAPRRCSTADFDDEIMDSVDLLAFEDIPGGAISSSGMGPVRHHVLAAAGPGSCGGGPGRPHSYCCIEQPPSAHPAAVLNAQLVAALRGLDDASSQLRGPPVAASAASAAGGSSNGRLQLSLPGCSHDGVVYSTSLAAHAVTGMRASRTLPGGTAPPSAHQPPSVIPLPMAEALAASLGSSMLNSPMPAAVPGTELGTGVSPFDMAAVNAAQQLTSMGTITDGPGSTASLAPLAFGSLGLGPIAAAASASRTSLDPQSLAAVVSGIPSAPPASATRVHLPGLATEPCIQLLEMCGPNPEAAAAAAAAAAQPTAGDPVDTVSAPAADAAWRCAMSAPQVGQDLADGPRATLALGQLPKLQHQCGNMGVEMPPVAWPEDVQKQQQRQQRQAQQEPAVREPPMPLPTSGQRAVDHYLWLLQQDCSPDRFLFLSKRTLGIVACHAIGCFLTQSGKGVRIVSLMNCNITDEGLNELLPGLRMCCDTMILDLSGNLITDAGVQALALALQQMRSLLQLQLSGNAAVGDVGLMALAAACRLCPSLRKVGSRGTGASQPAAKDLQSALNSNSRRNSRVKDYHSRPTSASALVTGAQAPVSTLPTATAGAAAAPIAAASKLGMSAAADASPSAPSTTTTDAFAQLSSILRVLSQPSLPAELLVASAVSELLHEAEAAGQELNLEFLADGLSVRGFDVSITHALGGGLGTECLRNLRHRFLSVTCHVPTRAGTASGSAAPVGVGASRGSSIDGSCWLACQPSTTAPMAGLGYPGTIIVDPAMREQFDVASPTPRYEALVAALPRVYVGAEERLPLVVEALCEELAMAFRAKGLMLPPWRESAAMITKWQPRQASSSSKALTASGQQPPSSSSGQSTPRMSASGVPTAGQPGIGRRSWSVNGLPCAQLPVVKLPSITDVSVSMCGDKAGLAGVPDKSNLSAPQAESAAVSRLGLAPGTPQVQCHRQHLQEVAVTLPSAPHPLPPAALPRRVASMAALG